MFNNIENLATGNTLAGSADAPAGLRPAWRPEFRRGPRAGAGDQFRPLWVLT